MVNLREKILKEYKHYSKSEKELLIKRSIEVLGKEVHIVICLEEIAELIEVILKNTDKTMDIDAYIHTAEEIADLEIVHMMLRNVANIELENIVNTKLDNGGYYHVIDKRDSFIEYLVLTQQKISKYMRYNEYKYAEKAYDFIDSVLYRIYDFYKINFKDVNKIIDIKFDRFEKRTIEAEEANKNQDQEEVK